MVAQLAIVLQRAIAANVSNFTGGIEGVGTLSRQPQTAPQLAHAFGTTFWIAVGLIAAALTPALLLPRRSSQQHAKHAVTDDDAEQQRHAA